MWVTNHNETLSIITARIRGVGKVMFSQVSVHSHGGYPSLRFFPRSLDPGSLPGGIPVSGSFPDVWSQVLSEGGYPVPGRGNLDLDGGYPSPRQDRTGVLPPQARTAEGVLAMQQTVCLLRSRRRTFLFPLGFEKNISFHDGRFLSLSKPFKLLVIHGFG